MKLRCRRTLWKKNKSIATVTNFIFLLDGFVLTLQIISAVFIQMCSLILSHYADLQPPVTLSSQSNNFHPTLYLFSLKTIVLTEGTFENSIPNNTAI